MKRNDEIDRPLQQQARALKRQAALMSEMAAELETEAEAVLALLARYHAPNVDAVALLADLTAYHKRCQDKQRNRWPQFIAAINAAAQS